MRLWINYTFVLSLTIAAVSSAPAAAQDKPPSDKPARAELALDYTYLRSNAPPGGCGCFNLNGGSATFAWTFPPASSARLGSFALVGDVTAVHAGAITSTGYSLTLSAFTAGLRYLPRVGHSTWQPFGQVLVGAAHSTGTLVEGQSPATANAGAVFAANVGGGLDLRASRRFSIRLIDADYLVTTFDNAVNNHQNNLRIGAGLVLFF
jgi:peptidoglycan-associated lipoprotein